jgi:hypothetical protein
MKTIYIIPGNPGHPIFYESFIKRLREITGYNVVINPLPGHTLETAHTKSSLRDAIRYHTKQIKTYENVILIGHSIGCFLGLQVTKRVTNIERIILLFPTIVYMAETPGGEYMEKVKPLYKFIAPIADYFPSSLSNWLANSEHGHLIFHKQIVLNCLALWDEEKLTVTTPKRISFTKDKHDYFVIYSTKDHWTPPSVISILKRMFPIIVETECDHSFVLNDADCELVSKHIQMFLSDIYSTRFS